MSFNGRKLAGNEQIDRKFMFMKKVTAKLICISEMSGERLQDHWSSGLRKGWGQKDDFTEQTKISRGSICLSHIYG